MEQTDQQMQQLGNFISQQSGIKMSTVVKDCIKALGLKSKKNWPGTNFYGLASADYRCKHLEEEGLKKKNNCSSDSSSSPKSNLNQAPVDNSENGFKYEWVDVLSYGEFRDDKNFMHNDIPLNVGFSSERKVTRQDFSITIRCTIGIDDSCNLPLYTCSSENEAYSDHQISTCVKKFLTKIGCLGKKHWSGFDFFGLSRKTVSNVLENMKKKNIVKCDNERKSLLTKLNNTIQRNAGPTCNLSSTTYQNARNELIHNVVDATSLEISSVSHLFYFYTYLKNQSIIFPWNLKL